MKFLITCITICLLLMISNPSPTRGQTGDKTQEQAKTKTGQTKPATDKAQGDAKEKVKDEATGKDAPPAEEEASLIRRRGLDLLRQAGDEASNVSDGRYAARLQSEAADLLWDHDRETALKFFESAFDIAIRYYRDNKLGGAPFQNRPTSTRSMPPPMPRYDARMEIIKTASRRDSALGRRLMDQYIEEKRREQQENAQKNGGNNSNSIRVYGNVDPIANDLLTAADMLYQSDPKAAMELAQRAFSSGVPQSAPGFLGKLAGEDRPAADGLFLLGLNRISGDPALPVPQLLLISAYPFGEDHVWIMPGSRLGLGVAVPKNFAIDPRLIQQFFAVSVGVLSAIGDLNPTSSPEVQWRIGMALFAAGLLRPKVARFQPEQSAQLDALINKLTTASTPEMTDAMDKALQNIDQTKTPDTNPNNGDQTAGLLDQADKTSDVVKKDVLYQKAALDADHRGETDRALSIADKITDREYRDQTKGWLYFEAATRAIKDRRYDDARRYATLVDELDQSAYLYCQIAEAAAKDKDQPRAAQLLDESLRRALSAADSVKKVNALLGIANVYSSFDTVLGFEVTADAVRTANKVRDYGIEQNLVFRNLNANGRGGMASIIGVEGFDIDATLILLGRVDFDRSLLLAQSLDNKLVRLNSVIAVAASVLQTRKTAVSR